MLYAEIVLSAWFATYTNLPVVSSVTAYGLLPVAYGVLVVGVNAPLLATCSTTSPGLVPTRTMYR